MKNGKRPDPDVIHPIPGYDKEIYVRPSIDLPNVSVGDFTYIADGDFASHVTHHYEHIGDKLIIGKFCQIASGVEFVMNGANHQMNAVTTFPFFTLEGWSAVPPAKSDLPYKGDTVIGNDVWIGQNATILPGVHIGDGAIIGAQSVVGSDVAPYTIVAGNPANVIRKRFDDDFISLLLEFRWWDKSIDEIDSLIPLLTSGDIEDVRKNIKEYIKNGGNDMAFKKKPKVDRKELAECIAYLENVPEFEWTPAYPYTEEAYRAVSLLETDYDYGTHCAEIKEKGKKIEELSYDEIKAVLTSFMRAERFCDGAIMGVAEDGSLLAVLRRLEELTR